MFGEQFMGIIDAILVENDQKSGSEGWMDIDDLSEIVKSTLVERGCAPQDVAGINGRWVLHRQIVVGRKKQIAGVQCRNLEVHINTSDKERLEDIVGPLAIKWGHVLNQYVDFEGRLDFIEEEEAQERFRAGKGVGGMFLKMYPSAPGIGVVAGRKSSAVSPIHDSIMIWFDGIVASRGDAPGYSRGGELPDAQYYFSLEGKLVKSKTYEEVQALKQK